ncbi:sulfite exporter TauE/SafE family protein [Amphritea balenae]|uniref:Probable membrane transporter protein n=2 Tax=Amphritea balenae TaxID=452629 RepID=A0A3P1SK20_9GAMM|nr:sulfite exporter TauE/SafE family protein [Amphritea balenae]
MLYTFPELIALLIVICGIVLQTWFGIGFGLVAAPLLFLINPSYVPGPILILGTSLSVLVVSRLMLMNNQGEFSWRRIAPAIFARLPGAWLGALLLVSIPAWSLSLLFGVTLLLAVLLTWKVFKVQTTKTSLIIAGFFSGLIGTATSVGGPPMALVYQEQNRITIRNELAAFFLIGTPFSILALYLQGNIDTEIAMLSLKMLPGVIIGFWLANKFDGNISPKSAKPVLLLVSAVSALLVIGKGLSGWLGT